MSFVFFFFKSETKRIIGTSLFCFDYISSICISVNLSPLYLHTHCFILYFCCQVHLLGTKEAMKSLFLSIGKRHEIFCSHMPEREHDVFSLKLETRSSKFWFTLRIDWNKYQSQYEKPRRTHAGAHIPIRLKSYSTIKQVLILFKSFSWLDNH